MSFEVTQFAPEGWSLPKAAEQAQLSREESVLITSGFLNHSMAKAPITCNGDNGVLLVHRMLAQREQDDLVMARKNSAGPKPKSAEEMANDWREAGRHDEAKCWLTDGHRPRCS